MKRLYYIAILLCAVLVASCGKDALDVPGVDSTTEGLLNISLNTNAATRADGPYSGKANIRIYAYKDKTVNDEKELIRHYFSTKELPTEGLWLLKGDYCVTVSIGDGETPSATFDGKNKVYYGEQDFEITAGTTTDVAVDCKIQNTLIKVVFDDSLATVFNKVGKDETTGNEARYFATVVASNGWDNAYKTKGLPYLDYLRHDMPKVYGTSSEDETLARTGYFVLPAGLDKIAYCFHGFSNDESIVGADPNGNTEVNGEVHIHRTKTLTPVGDTSKGVLYTLTFKYSPDVEGYVKVDFDITVADVEPVDDVKGVDPSPKPRIEIVGASGDVYDVARESLEYTASYVTAAIETIKFELSDVETTRAVAETVIDCTKEYNKGGIHAVPSEDGHTVTLTFGPEFLNKLRGGTHDLKFTLIPTDGKENVVKSKIRTQGVYAFEPAWKKNKLSDTGLPEFGTVYAHAFAPSAVIKYRKKSGGEWTAMPQLNEVKAAEKFYSAVEPNFARDTEYEVQLYVDNKPKGAPISGKTQAGAPGVIPNAGFETWTQPGKSLLPYDGEQFWDTGNHGSTTLGDSWNITTNQDDPRPDSPGTTSAKLASKWVIMKFAAGNIFVGQYAGTDGTDGVIAFGKPFTFNYRPKKLRFWYKANIGKINRGSGAPGVSTGDPDPNEIYIMLCNMGGPHIVATKDKNTFVTPYNKTISYCTDGSYSKSSKNDKTDGHVIAYGVWNNTQNVGEWTMHELELTYNSEYEGEIPNYLMLTASASKYGDYFMGYDSNWLQLDDVELVY